MSDVKKKLLKEIDQKILKRREAKARAAQRNTIDNFVLEFIANIEDLNAMTSSEEDWKHMAMMALNSLHDSLKSFDAGCKVDVSWHESQDGKKPQVNFVLIKWSKYYQEKNQVDPELSVDIASLLFK